MMNLDADEVWRTLVTEGNREAAAFFAMWLFQCAVEDGAVRFTQFASEESDNEIECKAEITTDEVITVYVANTRQLFIEVE